MITLHLFGKLAKDFGNTVQLEAKTPREAVTALMYQSSEYKEHLRSNDWHIFVGKDNNISESELDLQLGAIEDVYLAPRIEGSSGGLQIVIGAVLVVVGAILIATGVGGPVGIMMVSAGIGMIVSGIVQNMLPDPAVTADSNSSFLFNGPTNSSKQGVAIPRGYGRCLIGSTVISAALYAEAI